MAGQSSNKSKTYCSLLSWLSPTPTSTPAEDDHPLGKVLSNLVTSDEVYSLTQVNGQLSEHPHPTNANKTTLCFTFNLHGKEQTITSQNTQAIDQQLAQRREVDTWVITDTDNHTSYKYHNRYDEFKSSASQSAIDKTIAHDLPRCYYGWVVNNITEKQPHQSFVAKQYNWYWGIMGTECFDATEAPHFLQTISSLQQSWRNTKIISGLGAVGLAVGGVYLSSPTWGDTQTTSSLPVLEDHSLQPASLGTNRKLLSTENDLTTGLMAYYPFNGNADDASKNGNNGVVHGATLTEDMHGTPNSAYLFNGVDNWISVPDSPSLNPTNQLTISLWIKNNGMPNGFWPLIHKGGLFASNYANREYSLWLNKNYYIHITAAANENGQKEHNYNQNIPKDNNWLHFAGVLDRTSHRVRLYIDGKPGSSYDDSYSGFNPNEYEMRIGSSEEEAHVKIPFKGIIDDIYLYNRALTDAEITALYVKYKNPKPDLERGLAAYYPFNGNTNDESKNSRGRCHL